MTALATVLGSVHGSEPAAAARDGPGTSAAAAAARPASGPPASGRPGSGGPGGGGGVSAAPKPVGGLRPASAHAKQEGESKMGDADSPLRLEDLKHSVQESGPSQGLKVKRGTDIKASVEAKESQDEVMEQRDLANAKERKESKEATRSTEAKEESKESSQATRSAEAKKEAKESSEVTRSTEARKGAKESSVVTRLTEAKAAAKESSEVLDVQEKNKESSEATRSTEAKEESKGSSEVTRATAVKEESGKVVTRSTDAMEESKESSEVTDAQEESKVSSKATRSTDAKEDAKESSEVTDAKEESKESSEATRSTDAKEESKESSEVTDAQEENKESSKATRSTDAKEEAKKSSEVTDAQEESKESSKATRSTDAKEGSKESSVVTDAQEDNTESSEVTRVTAAKEESRESSEAPRATDAKEESKESSEATRSTEAKERSKECSESLSAKDFTEVKVLEQDENDAKIFAEGEREKNVDEMEVLNVANETQDLAKVKESKDSSGMEKESPGVEEARSSAQDNEGIQAKDAQDFADGEKARGLIDNTGLTVVEEAANSADMVEKQNLAELNDLTEVKQANESPEQLKAENLAEEVTQAKNLAEVEGMKESSDGIVETHQVDLVDDCQKVGSPSNGTANIRLEPVDTLDIDRDIAVNLTTTPRKVSASRRRMVPLPEAEKSSGGQVDVESECPNGAEAELTAAPKGTVISDEATLITANSGMQVTADQMDATNEGHQPDSSEIEQSLPGESVVYTDTVTIQQPVHATVPVSKDTEPQRIVGVSRGAETGEDSKNSLTAADSQAKPTYYDASSALENAGEANKFSEGDSSFQAEKKSFLDPAMVSEDQNALVKFLDDSGREAGQISGPLFVLETLPHRSSISLIGHDLKSSSDEGSILVSSSESALVEDAQVPALTPPILKNDEGKKSNSSHNDDAGIHADLGERNDKSDSVDQVLFAKSSAGGAAAITMLLETNVTTNTDSALLAMKENSTDNIASGPALSTPESSCSPDISKATQHALDGAADTVGPSSTAPADSLGTPNSVVSEHTGGDSLQSSEKNI